MKKKIIHSPKHIDIEAILNQRIKLKFKTNEEVYTGTFEGNTKTTSTDLLQQMEYNKYELFSFRLEEKDRWELNPDQIEFIEILPKYKVPYCDLNEPGEQQKKEATVYADSPLDAQDIVEELLKKEGKNPRTGIATLIEE